MEYNPFRSIFLKNKAILLTHEPKLCDYHNTCVKINPFPVHPVFSNYSEIKYLQVSVFLQHVFPNATNSIQNNLAQTHTVMFHCAMSFTD